MFAHDLLTKFCSHIMRSRSSVHTQCIDTCSFLLAHDVYAELKLRSTVFTCAWTSNSFVFCTQLERFCSHWLIEKRHYSEFTYISRPHYVVFHSTRNIAPLYSNNRNWSSKRPWVFLLAVVTGHKFTWGLQRWTIFPLGAFFLVFTLSFIYIAHM